jgi:hypothetical protein
MSSLFNKRRTNYSSRQHRERVIAGTLAAAIVGATVLIALVLLDRYF